MRGAQAIRVQSRTRFAFGPYAVEIMRAEGGTHVRLMVEGWPQPSGRPGDLSVANFIAGPESAGELTAIRDHLEGLAWDGETV